MNASAACRVLITGATGYIGGRLLKEFEKAGRPVRCLVRHPEHLQDRVAAGTELVRGDALQEATVRSALEGVHTAYYLIHSMQAGSDFERLDRQAAEIFSRAASAAGVRRIIYLGGLADSNTILSAHMRSRQEVGVLLRRSGCQVIEFQASIVIGSGSMSFEMIRALVERLPVMVTPRWVSVPAQPIAVRDLLAYLVAAVDTDFNGNQIFEIGGADRITYAGLMREYARIRGLKRVMIPVPMLSPWLSSLWLALITPLFARIGRTLIESIRHPSVVRDDTASKVFSIRPVGIRDAMESALRNEDAEMAETHWSDAVNSTRVKASWGGQRFGNRLVDARSKEVAVPAVEAFAPIRRIGGRTGWYYTNALWNLRGVIDLWAGGVGMKRGRRDREHLRAGDVVDCWRVEAVENGRRLKLRAEMRLPGRAWLEFEVKPASGGSRIFQTAIFDPSGFSGLLYWYSVWPLHQLIFQGMLDRICERAVRPIRTDG